MIYLKKSVRSIAYHLVWAVLQLEKHESVKRKLSVDENRAFFAAVAATLLVHGYNEKQINKVYSIAIPLAKIIPLDVTQEQLIEMANKIQNG